MDRRHLRRQKIVQDLFASMFSHEGDSTDNEYHEKVFEVLKHKDEIDSHITQYAQKYDAENIAKVDLAILRLAIYELQYEQKVPPKVIINEAVELAKELGSEKSPAFVNAILGKVYEENPDNED